MEAYKDEIIIDQRSPRRFAVPEMNDIDGEGHYKILYLQEKRRSDWIAKVKIGAEYWKEYLDQCIFNNIIGATN